MDAARNAVVLAKRSQHDGGLLVEDGKDCTLSGDEWKHPFTLLSCASHLGFKDAEECLFRSMFPGCSQQEIMGLMDTAAQNPTTVVPFRGMDITRHVPTSSIDLVVRYTTPRHAAGYMTSSGYKADPREMHYMQKEEAGQKKQRNDQNSR
jgi:hypothetical protein